MRQERGEVSAEWNRKASREGQKGLSIAPRILKTQKYIVDENPPYRGGDWAVWTLMHRPATNLDLQMSVLPGHLAS